jgi:putative SOS response-associated peptidase YedK
MRWGFADRKSATPLQRPKHMHARSETIDKLPTFVDACAHARGILIVHTFNEGEELPNGKTKQWVITPQDREPIAIAVICERWTNGPDELDTFVMVTTPPNALISRITDRMPAVLPREAWPVWLGETWAPIEEVKDVLRTYEDGGNWAMTEQPTSKLVRRPKAQQSLF